MSQDSTGDHTMPSDHESSQASVHDEVASDQVDGDGGGLFGEGSDDEALGYRTF